MPQRESSTAHSPSFVSRNIRYAATFRKPQFAQAAVNALADLSVNLPEPLPLHAESRQRPLWVLGHPGRESSHGDETERSGEVGIVGSFPTEEVMSYRPRGRSPASGGAAAGCRVTIRSLQLLLEEIHRQHA